MAAGASRFRKLPKLPPPRRGVDLGVAARGRGAPVNGELFEHDFEQHGIEQHGIADPGPGSLGPVVPASPCEGCGWLRAAEELARACPLCGARAQLSTGPR